jgi:hypothetical protein
MAGCLNVEQIVDTNSMYKDHLVLHYRHTQPRIEMCRDATKEMKGVSSYFLRGAVEGIN